MWALSKSCCSNLFLFCLHQISRTSLWTQIQQTDIFIFLNSTEELLLENGSILDLIQKDLIMSTRCFASRAWRDAITLRCSGTVIALILGLVLLTKEYQEKNSYAESTFGQNTLSWYFGIDTDLVARYNKESYFTSPPLYSRIGVFLDWSAGTLSFYKVYSSGISHIHTFKKKITDPLYPGFRAI